MLHDGGVPELAVGDEWTTRVDFTTEEPLLPAAEGVVLGLTREVVGDPRFLLDRGTGWSQGCDDETLRTDRQPLWKSRTCYLDIHPAIIRCPPPPWLLAAELYLLTPTKSPAQRSSTSPSEPGSSRKSGSSPCRDRGAIRIGRAVPRFPFNEPTATKTTTAAST